MSLESVTNQLTEKVGQDCGLGKRIKFDFGDQGILFLDATQQPNMISNENLDADCTVQMSLEDFIKLAAGEFNSAAAFMTGKLKVQGDMGIALQLGAILA